MAKAVFSGEVLSSSLFLHAHVRSFLVAARVETLRGGYLLLPGRLPGLG